MVESAKLAGHWDVRMHTHLAETLDEEQFCLDRFGLRTVDYLEKVGWLGPRTWLAHGIHFNPDEITRLGAAGTGICHCPVSNMRLASGICPTLDLEQAGATIGLGVDGSASNDASNLMYETRQALYLQRLRYGAERITPQKVLGWATRGSARLLGREDIGEIRVGMQADLALFKMDELRFSGSHDPIAALILCGAERADYVMVGGQWRVIDGVIPGLDIASLIAQHRTAASALVS
jgi:8-oxoguanine deaminase